MDRVAPERELVAAWGVDRRALPFQRMELLATGNGQTIIETGAPTHCPSGHPLGAGTMLAGYDTPEPASVGRSRTVTCRACWAVWFDGWGWRHAAGPMVTIRVER